MNAINSAPIEWHFAGPLGRLPAATAEKIVIAAAVLGLLWIVASYGWTLARLSVARRVILCALRGVFWLALLFALLGPTRVETSSVKREPRPLAVLVDRSDSMTDRDQRGQSRLGDALRHWRVLEPGVELTTRSHVFARTVKGTAAVDEPAGALDAQDTRLYDALLTLLHDAPANGWAGIVTLTDGLDTSGERPLERVTTAALAAGTPLYFAVGENQPPKREIPPFVSWLELNVPADVRPNSVFTAELTVESFQSVPQKLPMRVRVGERWTDAEPLFLNAGRRATVWRTKMTAPDRGLVPIELRARNGDDELVARAEVRVLRESQHKRVLNHALALDWGQSFLDRLLRGEATLAVDSVFQPIPLAGATEAPRFPTTADLLDDYDVVVLSGASASRLSATQTGTLSGWVKRGGALLLVVPETGAAEGLVESALGELSPLTFMPPPPAAPEPEPIRQARLSVPQNVRYLSYDWELRFAAALVKATPPVRRNAFVWSPGVAEQLAVHGELPVPVYATSVAAVQMAPGAEVLARRTTSASARDDPSAVIFAVQRLGAGRVATLACDALWQWKMALPETSLDAERFWRAWFRWFATQPERHLQFVHAPLYCEVGRPVTFRVAGLYTRPAQSLVVRDDRLKGKVELKGRDHEASTYSWTPVRPGFWTVEAQDETGGTARHWITVRPGGGSAGSIASGERSGQPPDQALLRELAARTGGAVLGDTPPSGWKVRGESRTEVVARRRILLWHDARWFAVLLGLYGLELLLRRVFRML